MFCCRPDVGGEVTPPGACVPHVPSFPLCTQIVASVRIVPGALTRRVIDPGRVKATVACPWASVLAGASGPLIVAPETAADTPVLLKLLTVTCTGSPVFARFGASIPSGAGAGWGHDSPKHPSTNRTRSPALTCASHAPAS